MDNNNQGPLLQNMAMMQKQQLLSEQQYYDYPSNPNITQYNNYPSQNYTPGNGDSNNQEIYVHNSLNESILTSLMRDLNRIYAKLKVVALPVASEAKNKELKQWDLWGPFIICLLLGTILCFTTKKKFWISFFNDIYCNVDRSNCYYNE